MTLNSYLFELQHAQCNMYYVIICETVTFIFGMSFGLNEKKKDGCPSVIEWAVRWKYEFIDDMTSVYSNQCFMLGAALEQPFNCVIKLATSIAALTYKYPTHIHFIYDTHISWTNTFLMRYALYEFNGHSTRRIIPRRSSPKPATSWTFN